MNNLSASLKNRVLDRLGLEKPSRADLESLRQLYGAWCRHLPFDNVRKMIALAGNGKQALPGTEATDFFESWLSNGSGATCWPMANALCELLGSLGFATVRIAGYMRDMGVLNHGSIKVTI